MAAGYKPPIPSSPPLFSLLSRSWHPALSSSCSPDDFSALTAVRYESSRQSGSTSRSTTGGGKYVQFAEKSHATDVTGPSPEGEDQDAYPEFARFPAARSHPVNPPLRIARLSLHPGRRAAGAGLCAC